MIVFVRIWEAFCEAAVQTYLDEKRSSAAGSLALMLEVPCRGESFPPSFFGLSTDNVL